MGSGLAAALLEEALADAADALAADALALAAEPDASADVLDADASDAGAPDAAEPDAVAPDAAAPDAVGALLADDAVPSEPMASTTSAAGTEVPLSIWISSGSTISRTRLDVILTSTSSEGEISMPFSSKNEMSTASIQLISSVTTDSTWSRTSSGSSSSTVMTVPAGNAPFGALTLTVSVSPSLRRMRFLNVCSGMSSSSSAASLDALDEDADADAFVLSADALPAASVAEASEEPAPDVSFPLSASSAPPFEMAPSVAVESSGSAAAGSKL